MASTKDHFPPMRKLTRLGSFSSRDVFCAWARDSLLKKSTLQTLMEVHQVDSLPAVLALRNKDITRLNLPIGQARLFEQAVEKLHSEYKYNEPPSPQTKVDIEFPHYKTLLDDASVESHKTKGRFTFDTVKELSNGFDVESSDTLCADEENVTQKKLLESEYDDETQTGCACERWLFVVIFMPIVLVFAIFGAIAWIILWPCNRYCNCGKPFSKVFSTAETCMKLPFIVCRWAIGRRSGYDVEQNEDSRPKYGGTDVVEMKESPRTD